jgi:hypothetical protein
VDLLDEGILFLVVVVGAIAPSASRSDLLDLLLLTAFFLLLVVLLGAIPPSASSSELLDFLLLVFFLSPLFTLEEVINCMDGMDLEEVINCMDGMDFSRRLAGERNLSGSFGAVNEFDLLSDGRWGGAAGDAVRE